MTFRDRREAGCLLARRLSHLRPAHPLVIAIPPAAVEIATAIAGALGADVDLLFACELTPVPVGGRSPGAVAEGGAYVLARRVAERLGLSAHELRELVAARRAEAERRGRTCRAGRDLTDPRARTAIVVAEGVNGALAPLAALRAVRETSPLRLVLATPIAEARDVRRWRTQVDELVVLDAPPELIMPGYWYTRPAHPSDEEVATLLERARRGADAGSQLPGM